MSGVGKIEKKAGNRFLSYYELEAIHRDGSTSPYYMASRNPDTAALTAVTHQNRPNGVSIYSLLGEKVVLVRQYRYPVGGYVYEFPAGLVEPGENVQQAAIREMYEETGLKLELDMKKAVKDADLRRTPRTFRWCWPTRRNAGEF